MRPVWFVDTSVLCNLLPVPGRDQDRELVKGQLRERQNSGDMFVLPLTTVIETGNHIAHGRDRYRTAEKFRELLSLVMKEEARWRLHAFSWDENFLRRLVDGTGTESSMVYHLVNEIGCGDICILVERDIYRDRTGLDDVRIWALDSALAAYS